MALNLESPLISIFGINWQKPSMDNEFKGYDSRSIKNSGLMVKTRLVGGTYGLNGWYDTVDGKKDMKLKSGGFLARKERVSRRSRGTQSLAGRMREVRWSVIY